ncbi:hypothetical protein ACLOAV_002682 [Pseudogymnoascus australis]
MPIINGMKMACEPCIRGHRSTKCTHANERLMVPVKKPGRPLTACPHLQPQSCGCSSITAAIPRKSQCGCGPESKTGKTATTVKTEPQTVDSPITESPSPVARDFKIKKASKAKNRKQSYDAAVLNRVDPSSVNVVPFTPRPQQLIAPALPNEAKPAMQIAPYTNGNQNHTYQQTQPLPYSADTPYAPVNGNGVYPGSNGNGVGRPFVPHDQLPGTMLSSRSNSAGSSYGAPTNGVKPEYDTHESEIPQSSCCSKPAPDASLDGMIFANGAPLPTMPNYTYVPTYPISAPLYPYPQPTLFAYPPSYGSHNNPLQPASWRQNMYAAPSDVPPYPLQPDLNMALHSCGCGPTCQCVGCAAHPYNDATQEYVRSAYAEPVSPPDAYGVVYPPVYPTNDGTAVLEHGAGANESTHETPSEGGSMADEQALSPSDFFFVSYPLSGDGCGGDTTSCPCGDGCQCLGCTIHALDEVGKAAGMVAGEEVVPSVPAPAVEKESGDAPAAETSNGEKKSCCCG